MKLMVKFFSEELCKSAPVIILWTTLFLVQILLAIIVILIAQTGCRDLETINKSFDPDFAPSFIVGPRDFLYGPFQSDYNTSEIAMLLDITRIGLFSKMCDTVESNKTSIFDISSYKINGNNVGVKNNFSVLFNYQFQENSTIDDAKHFCNALRDLKKCSLFGSSQLTFQFKGETKSINSVIDVKQLLNETHIPIIIHFPKIPRVVYLNNKCIEAGIITEQNDPYGLFEYTQQYTAFSGESDRVTAIIVGWNDDTMTSLLDGTSIQGGFIARIVGEENTTRHSVDWWMGNVSVDVETQRCGKNNSYTNWICWNNQGSEHYPFTTLKLSPKIYEESVLEGIKCANLTITSLDENNIELNLYELLKKGMFNESIFVPLCTNNKNWPEFDVVQNENNFFDITLTEFMGDELRYRFNHVWKEFLETYFVPYKVEGLLQETHDETRNDCAYSFIPYQVLTTYMKLNPERTHFHSFYMNAIDCSNSDLSSDNFDLSVDLLFQKRNFSLLPNDVVFASWPKVQFEDPSSTKDEL
ncbi:hypothetical protein ENU1_208880 [Entamoeba nuttalli P19]|uniref:Uncharacterized protein n=1 Tax=Entamoeba nuttalli (strain P19) TaxID=1076696 RepID=K2G4C1_ENTNP|nr:hypothetical protein ENU1_208880 [Entamoeba nuttalli P19]EKE37116.1 hypothetical protein ENU1_208880 [Entamoeba nuttalli P19]|eukprot:XP_008860549.1 hypothetical protein ENU1_208880 [Entamoeba nuttalli P19]